VGRSPESQFATDSPLEEDGFELPVPPRCSVYPNRLFPPLLAAKPCRDRWIQPEGPMVRIRLPPAESRANFRSVRLTRAEEDDLAFDCSALLSTGLPASSSINIAPRGSPRGMLPACVVSVPDDQTERAFPVSQLLWRGL
jgi:hypothetical protein